MARCSERETRTLAKSTSRLTLEAPVLGPAISQDTFQISSEALLVQAKMLVGSQVCLSR
jgi:hypothetical protein